MTKKLVVPNKKYQKAKSVLAFLYQEGPSTLSQLAEAASLSIPSITGIIEQLIDEKWVSPDGIAIGNNGRRPALYSLQPDGHYVVILDSNTYSTCLMIVNPLRQVVFQRTFDLHLKDDFEFLPFLSSLVTDCLAESTIARTDIIGIGLAIPGLIDTRRGINLTYPNLNLPDQSFTTWLEQQLDIPVYLINDTKATALGETRFGSARSKKHALSINIDWGVGLGIVLNGEVFQGTSGFAGELGHIQIDPNGELCLCGKIGCLNTITSAEAVVKRSRQAVLDGCVSQLAIYRDEVGQLTIQHIIEAAHQGDSFAIDILYDTGYQLGKGLAIAINLFNPEIIIVDGVLAQASVFITNPIEQAINKHCLSGFRNDVTIEVTQLNGTARWLGTHAYVMETIFAAF